MAKLKNSKKQPAKKKVTSKQKSTQGNKSILSFLYIPMVIIAAAILGFGYFLMTILLDPVDSKHRESLVTSIATQYEAYVNNVLDQHEDLLNLIAGSEDIILLVEKADPAAIGTAEKRIESQIPNGLSVHISPLRSATLDLNANPPLSHAGLDMIRRAEQGQNLSIEAHQHEGTAYLQSVKAVRNSNGRLIGTIAIAQSLDYLKNQLGGIDASKGNLLIQQQFVGAPVQNLVTYGIKNRNEVIRLRSQNPNWTLTFQPADELAYSSVLDTKIIWIAFAALMVICCIPVFLAGQRLQATLRHDANSFAKQVQNLLAGQATAEFNFEFAIFTTLAKTLNRMRMGKFTPAGGNVIDSGFGRSGMGDDQNSLDVPMIEGDADLLGISSPAPAPVMVDISEEIFRSYDICGIVGQTLTNNAAEQIGLAVGSEAYERGEQTIVVARDGRLSSSEVSQAIVKGLLASGRDVVDIGEVPTPVCYFACEHLNIGSCVMVTGGESPANFNGFLINIAGNPIIGDELTGIYHRIANQNFLSGGGNLSTQDVTGSYLTKITENIQTKRALKIVVDCGNGVSGNIAPQFIKGIGSHVLPLFCNVDGNFPNHQPNPTDANNLQDLTRTVVETRADLGVAFDEDANRVVVVTNSGTVVHSDRILMLLAKQLVQQNPGASVLFDVNSTRRLRTLVSSYGGKPVMWKTGDANIKLKMKETQALLAGEMNGYYFFKDRWYGFDDAFYAVGRLVELLSNQDETIDTLLNELPADIATPELTIRTADLARKTRIIETMQRECKFEGGQVVDIDGARVDFKDGWGIVRGSNSSTYLNCRFEAENEQALRNIQAIFKQQLLSIDRQLQIPF